MNIKRKSIFQAAILAAAAAGIGPTGDLSAQTPDPTTRPVLATPANTYGPPGGYYGFRHSSDWEDMMAFLEANSPNRARVLADLPADSDLRLSLVRKWRIYSGTRLKFPNVADVYVQRFRVEDQIFGLMMEARRYPASRSSIRSDIRAKIAELVKLGIQERQLRIDRMQELLDEEKAKLANEQQSQESDIDDRTSKIFSRLEMLDNRRAPQATPVSQ